MTSIIIGNLCSLLAMATDAISSSRKTARGVLLAQIFSQIFYGASAAVLKGYSAVVQNLVSILRNLTAIQPRRRKYLEWLLIALAVVLGIVFNNRGIIGWLPVIANLEYSLAVFKFKDNDHALKVAFLLNTVMFGVFNAVILNFVGTISNIIVAGMTVFFLIKARKNAKSEC